VCGRGVRFGATGPETFVVDPVPRLLTATEWAALDRGLRQRIRALDAFCRDVYAERRIFADGGVPERIIDTEFCEEDMRGVEQPVWVGFAGLDLVRGPDGAFRVLEDNVRMPTGPGFAAHALEIAAETLGADAPPGRPETADVFADFAASLREAAPDGGGDPALAVLGDDADNHAQWEIEDIARRLGAPAVRLADLRVLAGRLVARVDGAERPVDVLYRRSNDHLLRGEDGTPGPLSILLEPMRRGTLAVVNPPGSGVVDDKLAHAYVPEMVRFYLGEEPLLASATTYDLADEAAREEALGRMDELVVKVRDQVGGEGVHFGADAALVDAIRARPRDHIAQERVDLSVHPTHAEGALVPRRVDLRPLVHGGAGGREPTLASIGLTRVALAADGMVVNMAQGGGIKATWPVPDPA